MQHGGEAETPAQLKMDPLATTDANISHPHRSSLRPFAFCFYFDQLLPFAKRFRVGLGHGDHQLSFARPELHASRFGAAELKRRRSSPLQQAHRQGDLPERFRGSRRRAAEVSYSCWSRSYIAQLTQRLTARSLAHEVDVKFSSDASHEVMVLLAQVACTIARLEQLQLQGLTRLETLAANLQRARLALQHVLIQASLEWCAWGAHRKRQLEQRASCFSVFPGSVRPLSTTWPWTIKPSLAVLWGVCWQFYASSRSFGSTGGGGGGDSSSGSDPALAEAGAGRTRVRATLLEGQLGGGKRRTMGPVSSFVLFGRLREWVPEARSLRRLRWWPVAGVRGCAGSENEAVLADDETAGQICSLGGKRLRRRWRRAGNDKQHQQQQQQQRNARPWM